MSEQKPELVTGPTMFQTMWDNFLGDAQKRNEEALRSKKEALEAEYKEKVAEANKTKTDAENQLQDVEIWKEKLEEWRANSAAAVTDANRIKEEYSRKNKELADRERRLITVGGERKELEKLKEEYKLAQAKLENERKTLGEEKVALERRKVDFDQALDRRKRDLDQEKAALMLETNRLHSSQQAAHTIRKQLDDRERDIDSRSSASTALETRVKHRESLLLQSEASLSRRREELVAKEAESNRILAEIAIKRNNLEAREKANALLQEALDKEEANSEVWRKKTRQLVMALFEHVGSKERNGTNSSHKRVSEDQDEDTNESEDARARKRSRPTAIISLLNQDPSSPRTPVSPTKVILKISHPSRPATDLSLGQSVPDSHTAYDPSPISPLLQTPSPVAQLPIDRPSEDLKNRSIVDAPKEPPASMGSPNLSLVQNSTLRIQGVSTPSPAPSSVGKVSRYLPLDIQRDPIWVTRETLPKQHEERWEAYDTLLRDNYTSLDHNDGPDISQLDKVLSIIYKDIISLDHRRIAFSWMVQKAREALNDDEDKVFVVWKKFLRNGLKNSRANSSKSREIWFT